MFPGQFVNARLLVDTEKDRVLVPVSAVQRGGQTPFVYVVKADHTATARNVTPGPSEGDHIVLEGGVDAGEVVIVDGADRVREGGRVDVRSARDGGSSATDGGFAATEPVDGGAANDGGTSLRPGGGPQGLP